jgi:pyrimidine operon attenuation protein/uracil phosphoribosyltransferase
MKVAVAVVLNKDGSKDFQLISNSVGKTVVDRVVILTDSNIGVGRSIEAKGGETVVNIDRSKMIDLLYFNSMYKSDEIKGDDLGRALALAKSIKLC